MTGRLRKLGIGVAAVLLALLAAAGTLELALRVGWIPNTRHFLAESERRWTEYPHRLLILGDSFTVPGGGLAPLLFESFGEHEVAVRNMAVSGTGPFEYVERLRDYLASDLGPPTDVLLGYYVGNDLTDVQYNPKYDPKHWGMAIRTKLPRISRPVIRSWYDRLHLVPWARNALREPPLPSVPRIDWSDLERVGYPRELIDAALAGEINPWLLVLSKSNPNHLLDNVLVETEENLAAWARSRELLAELAAECAAAGARLHVVAFPRSIQLDDTHLAFFEELRFRVDERVIGSTRPQELLADLCAELDVPLLDLYPVMARHEGPSLYLERDDHLNPEGNALAAREIVAWFVDRLE